MNVIGFRSRNKKDPVDFMEKLIYIQVLFVVYTEIILSDLLKEMYEGKICTDVATH